MLNSVAGAVEVFLDSLGTTTRTEHPTAQAELETGS